MTYKNIFTLAIGIVLTIVAIFIYTSYSNAKRIRRLEVPENHVAFVELHRAGVSPNEVLLVHSGEIVADKVAEHANASLIGYSVYWHDSDKFGVSGRAIHKKVLCTTRSGKYDATLKFSYTFYQKDLFSEASPSPSNKPWFKLRIEDTANLLINDVLRISNNIGRHENAAEARRKIDEELTKQMEKKRIPIGITLCEWEHLLSRDD